MIDFLRNLTLPLKLGFLIITGVLLYVSPLIILESQMGTYVVILSIVVLCFTILCRFTLGKRVFKSVLLFWGIGILIYLIIGVPRIYNMTPLSPYVDYGSIFARWMYTIAYPIRLLGTFAVGLIFVKISSPLEFLSWGKTGLYIALLLRVTQYSTEKFNEIRIALLMQNKWPEIDKKTIQFKNAWLTIKYAPTLVNVAIRNILEWYPWAWMSLNKLRYKMKGVNI